MRWARRILVPAALLVLVAVELGPLAEGQAPRRGGTLRIANIGEPYANSRSGPGAWG